MTNKHARPSAMKRRLAPVLALATLGGGMLAFAGPSGADVSAVTGSAYGYYANVSFFGTPQPVSGPAPTVTLPSTGGSETASDADGAEIVIQNIAELLQTGAITVDSQGTTGATGSVTSSADVAGYQDPNETPADPAGDGPDPFTWQNLTSTCSASEAGATATTEVVGGVVVTSTSTAQGSEGDPLTSVDVPVNPAPNHTVTGTINHAPQAPTFRIVFNEQTQVDGTLTVNAAHLYFLTGPVVGDLIIGQSVCGATVSTPTTTAGPTTTVDPTTSTTGPTTSTTGPTTSTTGPTTSTTGPTTSTTGPTTSTTGPTTSTTGPTTSTTGPTTSTTAPAAMCLGEEATIVGTPERDVLVGTAGRDVIAGMAGDDHLVGLGGDDLLCGGDGADHAVGGVGADRLDGGNGDDFCNGNRDEDEFTSCEQERQNGV